MGCLSFITAYRLLNSSTKAERLTYVFASSSRMMPAAFPHDSCYLHRTTRITDADVKERFLIA